MHKRQSRVTPLLVQVQAGKMESYKKSSLKTDSKSGADKSDGAKFPITRAILWDRSSTGKSQIISFSAQRKIRLYLSEKTLHLAAKHGNAASSFFIGSFITGSDGVFLQIDRFDPGRNIEMQTEQGSVTRRVPTAVIPGDHIISVKVLKDRCGKKHPVNVPDFFISRACCYYQTDIDEMIVDLSCDIVTFATDFEAKPIKSIPIIPTALAKNLSGPMRLSYVQGSPKFGYLTMDQTRKLLLLLENDPKVDSLPLVGIWISGVENISHPFTWACCLKFIRADYINERVIAPPSSFLLLHYPTSKGHPDFYECRPTLDANGGKVFDLLTCKEQLVLSSKKTTSDSQNDICFDLLPMEENDAEFDVKILTLNDSVRGYFTDLSVQREVALEGNGMPKRDASFMPIGQNKDKGDPSTPRPCPKPFTILAETHPRTPLVPELSLIEVQPIISSTREYNPQDYQENGTRERRNDVSQASVRSEQARIQHGRRTMPKDLLEISNTDVDLDDGVEDSCFIKRTVAHQGTIETDQDDVTHDANNSDAAGKVAQNDTILATTKDQLATAKVASEVLNGTEERGTYRDIHESRLTSATANCAMQTETLSVIAEHERQLFELRDQIRVLLQQKEKEELRRDQPAKVDNMSKAEISTQCSLMESRQDAISIGINTGESLIWNGRGPSEGALSCSCCEKCKRKITRSRPSQIKQSLETSSFEVNQDCPILTPNNGNHEKTPDVVESYSLSEIKDGDIHVHSLSENNMSASMQSFASDFNAVDLPVFDDSQNNDPNSPDDVELGASASMIYEQVNQNQVILNHSTKSPNHSGDYGQHTGSADEEEANFYKQMVEDVKDLLNDQVDAKEETMILEKICDPSDFRDLSQFSNSLEKGNGVSENTRQHDVLVDELKMGTFGATEVESRLVPKDGTVFHPRINYVSLLGNETGDEANVLADEIAMKYLTSNQVRDVKLNVTQKTKSVKFEGDVAGTLAGMPRINMNYVSVNVSCNMSIATKRYMQRYNLLESQPVTNLQLPKRNGPSAKDAAVRSTSTKEEDKENNQQSGKILDLKKLKRLSKLS